LSRRVPPAVRGITSNAVVSARTHRLLRTLGDTIPDRLVDFPPILDCAGKNGLGYSFIQVADHFGNQQVSWFLIIATIVQTQREGECTLRLVREGSPTLVSRLTFNFSIVDGRLALAVGGLQGPKAGHKHEVIDATRDLHGLRPKDATLAASAVADGLDAFVHAVGVALNERSEPTRSAGRTRALPGATLALCADFVQGKRRRRRPRTGDASARDRARRPVRPRNPPGSLAVRHPSVDLAQRNTSGADS